MNPGLYGFSGQSIASIGAGFGNGIIKYYFVSDNFTVPSGINNVRVWVLGAGGSGAANLASYTLGTNTFNNIRNVSGGGGGGLSVGVVPVTGGQVIPVIVGAGGASVNAGAGNSGGSSSFLTVIATGGSGGTIASVVGTAITGAIGGTASGGSILNSKGGSGGAVNFPSTTDGAASGGGSAGSVFGDGISAADPNALSSGLGSPGASVSTFSTYNIQLDNFVFTSTTVFGLTGAGISYRSGTTGYSPTDITLGTRNILLSLYGASCNIASSLSTGAGVGGSYGSVTSDPPTNLWANTSIGQYGGTCGGGGSAKYYNTSNSSSGFSINAGAGGIGAGGGAAWVMTHQVYTHLPASGHGGQGLVIVEY